MIDVQTEKDSHQGALFPRVHVSETRVPGPRAPPRNKMALFEQFTVPHHRFVPPLVQENSYKVNFQSSGQGLHSGFVKPKQVKLGQLSSKESDLSCGKAKCEAVKCSVAELCFHRETSKNSAACDSGEKILSSWPSRDAIELHSKSHLQMVRDCSTAESDIVYYAMRGHSSTDNKTQHSTTESRPFFLLTERKATQPCGWTGIDAYHTDKLHALGDAISENHSYFSAGVSHRNGIANGQSLVDSAPSSGRSAGISLTNEDYIGMVSLQVKKVADEGIHYCNGANGTDSLVQQMVCSDRSSEVAGVTGGQKRVTSLEKCDVDRWSLDTLPRIIPKNVIGVIGQREFWKARKTMLQQQKTLSMQIFELHRLIEVQRLIAAMPGLLSEGKGSTQPEIANVPNKLIAEELLNEEASHCVKPKQDIVRGPKQLMKLSCGVSSTCQNLSLQVLPSKPTHVSFDHSRVSTWGFLPTSFVKSQWLKAGSHSYELCGGPMAFEPSISGHVFNGQQVLQNGSCVFTNWSSPSFLSKDIPEVHYPPLVSQKLVNVNLIHQLDCAPGAQTTPKQAVSVLRKSSYSSLSPSSCSQRNKPNTNTQQEACTTERRPSSECKKLVSQPKKLIGDLDVPDMAKSMNLAGSHEFQSERSGLGFQTFCKTVSMRGDESDTIAGPAKLKNTISVTESYVAHKIDTLMSVPSEIVSSVRKGEENRVATSKVIRAVPHPASEAVQAAAKILKSIQQS